MTPSDGRAVDEAAGGATGSGDVAALLDGCLRRVDAFAIDPTTDPTLPCDALASDVSPADAPAAPPRSIGG